MAEAPNGIDVSHLDDLAKLRAEQQSLRELAAKAAAHRDKVTEVYTRVVRDYEGRVAALETRARDLAVKVREGFAALDRLYDQARHAVDQARFEQQESEFRHEIGEYSREEFQRRQKAAEEAIAARQQEFERIGTLRSRFLEILPEAASAAPAAGVPGAGPAPCPAATAASNAKTPAAPTPPVEVPPIPAGAAVAPPAPAGGETRFMPPPSATDFEPPKAPGAAAAPAGPSGAPGASDSERTGGFATVAISAALLIEERHGLPGINHRLGLHTTIGRTPDNQIVVPVREVSRKHAEIALSEAGYTLKDLGSPNGTFVNGTRITEHRLAEGDRLAVGGQVFVFKAH